MTDYVKTVEVWLHDGESPGELVKSCLFNMDRGWEFTTNLQETEIPNCQDEAAPATIVTDVRSIGFSITGTGMLDLDEYPLWYQWWKDGELKDVEIRVPASDTNPGFTHAGKFYLTAFGMEKAFKEAVRCRMTLTPENAAEVTLTPVPST